MQTPQNTLGTFGETLLKAEEKICYYSIVVELRLHICWNDTFLRGVLNAKLPFCELLPHRTKNLLSLDSGVPSSLNWPFFCLAIKKLPSFYFFFCISLPSNASILMSSSSLLCPFAPEHELCVHRDSREGGSGQLRTCSYTWTFGRWVGWTTAQFVVGAGQFLTWPSIHDQAFSNFYL